MNRNYNFKSLSIVENNLEEKTTNSDELNVFTLGESKCLDLKLKDGSRQSFHYSHFITSWLGKEDDLQVIKIFFSTHLVTIKGYCLEELYNYLIDHKVKNISEHDERYISPMDEDKVFVSEIETKWKKIDEKNKTIDG